MKSIIFISALIFGFSSQIFAGGADDPVLTKVMINELETSDEKGDPLTLDAEIWVGKDLNKFWIKTDVERLDGVTEESEIQLLYSRAISAYWDLQTGVRHDDTDGLTQDWVVIGFDGLAPYFIDMDAALFVAESGQASLRVNAEYEMMLTQRLVLSPEATVTFYTKDDPDRGIGSGLSGIDAAIRLRYEIKREFAPYIGLSWSNKFSATADMANANGAESSDFAVVVGFSAWF